MYIQNISIEFIYFSIIHFINVLNNVLENIM